MTLGNNDVHGNPGPSHSTVSPMPSPGENSSDSGVAVVVTVRMPRGVGTHAVTETGFHKSGFTQNHVGVFTTPR